MLFLILLVFTNLEGRTLAAATAETTTAGATAELGVELAGSTTLCKQKPNKSLWKVFRKFFKRHVSW
jgi:hypothetical protein